MSMISKLVDALKTESASMGKYGVDYMATLLIRAADTIEMLSEKAREPKWIPCSERLPKDDELMLVTYIDRREEAMPIWIGWHEMENVWYIDGDAHCEEIGNEVIAWMPLPKPYGEREGE